MHMLGRALVAEGAQREQVLRARGLDTALRKGRRSVKKKEKAPRQDEFTPESQEV